MGTGNMEFDNVQIDVTFSQASGRSNIASAENIALSFGKLSTWFEALVPEGGSSGQILGWNSSGTAKWINSPTIPTVNDGIFSIKKGSTNIVTFSANQSSNTDLSFVEGSNVTITPNSTNRTVTIASVDEKVKVDKFVSTTQTDYLLTGAVASMATTAAHLVVDNADGVASARMRLQKGTTDTIGQSMLMLGNNIASGTSKNMQGMILMYSSSDKYGKIVSESLTDNRTWTLPDKSGTIAMTSDIIPVYNGKLTIKGGTTSVAEFTANQSGDTDFSIVAGSNVTVTPDAENSKITIASSDTKVTSAANHYTPSRDTSADKTASASGATAAWSIDVVKGVTLNTDGKGHVTGLSVTSGKIPANPVPSGALFTDENVAQAVADSSYTNYRPLLIGNSSGTSAGFTPSPTTAGVYATAGIYCQPSSGYVYASDFMTNTYPSGTGSSLSQYGLYLKSYFKCADSSQTVLQYAGYGVRTYSGKITSSDGIAMAIGCGGLTVLGSGESAHNLISLISDDQKISGNTTLNVGGTLNTTFAGNSEVAIVSSDDSIYLITNCQTIANRKPVCLDTNSYFYPGTNKTGSIGTSSYMWNSVYAATIYENGTSLASKYATISHTHGLLHSDLSQSAANGTTGGWSVIGIDPAVTGYVLKSIRINQTSPNWLSGDYGAGIAFGGYDTKGAISMNYHLPTITFAGGNHSSSKTEPVWYIKISGTSGSTYNLDNLLWATLLKPISTTTTASASTWNIPSDSYQVWGERFTDTRLKYTPSGGTAQQITDTGDLVMWLTGNATANQATLNMRIDGTYYGSFSGNITGNVTGNVNGKLHNTGTGCSWWNDRDNAVIRITTGDTGYRPLWTLLTATSGSWGMGNHTGDDLTFNFISKTVYDSKANPSTYAQIKFTNTGAITANGLTLSNSDYGPLSIIRTGNGYYAGIKFYNNGSTYLGSFGIKTANDRFVRFKTDEVTSYTIIDTSLLNVTESTNLGLDGGTNAFGYVSGLTKAAWNFQQTDGTIIRQYYNTSWKSEIFMDYRTGQMSTRGKKNGEWQDWRIHLDSGNYTSYTVTKTGGGASGTWGISITGNATTSTTASKLSNTSAIGSSIQPVYFNASGVPVACTQDANQAHFSTVPFVRNDGVMEVGRYFDMHSTNTGTTDYDVRLDASGVSSFRFTFNTPASSSIAPSTNNQTSLGTSSLKWSNVYATTFYGNLSGTAEQAIKLRSSAARTDSTVDTADTTPYQKYWVKIASCYTTGNWADLESLWAVNDVYGNRQGILKVRARVEGTAGTFGNTRTIRWIVADSSIDVNRFAIVCYNNRKPDGTTASGTATVELWWKSTAQYASFSFVLLDETRRTGKEPNDWVLYDTSTYGQAALPTTGNITYSVAATILNSTTGTSANVTGTVAIANGGTGATTRLGALRALTEEDVGTSAQYFLTITDSWSHGGYTSVANTKSVLGIGATTSSGTVKHLAYYNGANSITDTGNIVYSVEDSTASTPRSRTILHLVGNQTTGNNATQLVSGVKGVLSYGDGGPQINFSTSGTIGGGQDSSIIWTDNDSAGYGASWHFVSNQPDWTVVSKRFHARTSISVGTDVPPVVNSTTATNYPENLYVAGTSKFTYSDFGPIHIVRSGSTWAAGIKFSNSNGLLGAIGMTGNADTPLIRWAHDLVTSYTILDTGNYTSYALATTTKYAGSSSIGGPATYVGLPRVTADSKSFPGQNKVEFKEYSNTSTNTPSSAWYHIISMQGADTMYGTQLALGMTTNAVYYRNYNNQNWIDWQPLGRFTATPTTGQVVITDGTTGGIKSSGSTISPNPSSVETTNWNTASERTIVVTKGWMSWWNGAYNGTSSNLAYCKKGEFGTIITKNTGDYVPNHGDLRSTIGSDCPAADVKTFFMTSSVPTATSSIGYNTAGNEYTLIFGKGTNTAGYGAVLKFGYNSLYPLMLRLQNGTWKSTDWEKISAGYADRATYLDVVASNEIRLYNDNQFNHNNHFWIGYAWAQGSHYTPSGGTDTVSTTAPNITKYFMGNCSGGGLAGIHVASLILGQGDTPTSSSAASTLKAAAGTTGTYLLPSIGNGTYTLSCGHEDLSARSGSLTSANVLVPSYTKFIKIVFKSDSSNTLYSMVEIPYFGNGDYSALVQVGTYADGYQGSPRIVMKAIIINIANGSETGKKTFTITGSPTTKINGSNVSDVTRNISIYKIYASD